MSLVDSITLWVPGLPVPQGSKTIARDRANTKQWLRDNNANALKAWRLKVATQADIGVEFDVPVTVELSFYLPKPKKPRWPVPAVKPDIDKLTRAVLDGLVDGGMLSNDSRVVSCNLTKAYASWGGPGVAIKVTAYQWESERSVLPTLSSLFGA